MIVTRKIISHNLLVKLLVSLNIKSFYNLLLFLRTSGPSSTYCITPRRITKQNEIDARKQRFFFVANYILFIFFRRYYIRKVEAERRTLDDIFARIFRYRARERYSMIPESWWSNEAIFFRDGSAGNAIRQRRSPSVILICSETFSTFRHAVTMRRLTRGAPTTCRDTGSLLTSLMLPLILLEARHMYWPCWSYVTFVRINRCPVPHSNGMRPSVNTCAHLHIHNWTLEICKLKTLPNATADVYTNKKI